MILKDPQSGKLEARPSGSGASDATGLPLDAFEDEFADAVREVVFARLGCTSRCSRIHTRSSVQEMNATAGQTLSRAPVRP